MNRMAGRVLLTVLAAVFSNAVVVAQTCTQPSAIAWMDVNNVSAKLTNSGALMQSDRWAYEVPKGSAVGTLRTVGLWMGGYRDTTLAVAGTDISRYTDYKPGPLSDTGELMPDCSSYDRIWLISRDDLDEYAASGVASSNLAQWPTGLGAPTLNRRGDVIHIEDIPLEERKNRLIDLEAGELPEMLGDEMAWWITNDGGDTHQIADGGSPLGVEVHTTAFARAGNSPENSTTFYRFRLFNKSGERLDSVFVGLFVDGDVGNAQDDYIGTDTLRQMVYFYNGDNEDEGTQNELGYGASPPALGFVFLDSPMGLTRTIRIWGSHYWPDGIPRTAMDYYNYLRGQFIDGSKLIRGGDGYDFFPGTPTTDFMFPAEPGEFWSELNIDDQGTSMGPSDRAMVMSSGPFEFQAGKSVALDFAIVWSRSTDYLASVDRLKSDADVIRDLYETEVINVRTEGRPYENQEIELGTLYPNPSATMSRLSFSLPGSMMVEIDLIDTLGRRVASLANRTMGPGTNSVEFSVADLSAGVYTLRFQTVDFVRYTQFVVQH